MSESYILAINCGSSSIKSKLYRVPASKSDSLVLVANATVSNIGAKGDKIKVHIAWHDAEGVGKLGEDRDEELEEGDKVECELRLSLSVFFPLHWHC